MTRLALTGRWGKPERGTEARAEVESRSEPRAARPTPVEAWVRKARREAL
jgi:hypothetical protein